jgi:hypothetical protein
MQISGDLLHIHFFSPAFRRPSMYRSISLGLLNGTCFLTSSAVIPGINIVLKLIKRNRKLSILLLR